MPTTRTQIFPDSLQTFGESTAVIDHDGRAISFNDLRERADRIAERLGQTRRLVFVEASNTIDSLAAYVACLRGRHPVHLFGHQSAPHLEALIEAYRPNAVLRLNGSEIDLRWIHRGTVDLHPALSVLLSTSGSTGSPKFVKLSHRNIESNTQAIAQYLALDSSERAMTTLPFHYSYGMSVVNAHLLCGGALSLTNYSVTDAKFWDAFRKTGATSFAGVPYTFEALNQSEFTFENLPTLRYATQAGGRLNPALISHFARLSSARGWRFVVMYGQTEAAPRIAYLTPDLVEAFPHSIGVPIPGGRIELLGDDGREIVEVDRPGQIAYSGPNVMMGYAERPEDLAIDETPARLLTGDVGCRNAQGLSYIVGRTSRFVKPFGTRLNLDDVEARLQADVAGAKCAGDDQRIVIAVGPGQREAGVGAAAHIARSAKMPQFLFEVIEFPELPRLPSGKIDYARILQTEAGRERARPDDPLRAVRLIFSRRFARRYVAEVADLLGVRPPAWRSVTHVYETLLGTSNVHSSDTFKSLAGDSLSYVQVTIALTDFLGALPADWPDRSVRDLDLLRLTRHDAIV